MLHASFLCGEEIIGFILTEKEDSHLSNFSHRAEKQYYFRSVFNINIVRKCYDRCTDKKLVSERQILS
jgi:hypothetical protein